MSSLRKIEANRANARKSTGPKTEAGKMAASANATRHGLTSAKLIAGDEKQEDFDLLLLDLQQSYKPANPAEQMLVVEIAQTFWRLQRARLVEAETFGMAWPAGQSVMSGFSFYQGLIYQVGRYMLSVERAWHRSIQQLERMQAARAKQIESEPQIGFVSQKKTKALLTCEPQAPEPPTPPATPSQPDESPSLPQRKQPTQDSAAALVKQCASSEAPPVSLSQSQSLSSGEPARQQPRLPAPVRRQ